MAAMLVYQSNPVGLGLFAYVNTFFRSHKLVWLLATWMKTRNRKGIRKHLQLGKQDHRTFSHDVKAAMLARPNRNFSRLWEMSFVIMQ